MQYLIIFLISTIPLAELRVAVPMGIAMGLPVLPVFLVCILGNMLPVPFIYLFSRRLLEWGKDKKYTGCFFSFCLNKGQKGGNKLMQKAGKGLFLALMLFVGIPVPGTGVWTGTLAASFLNIGLNRSTVACMLGVVMAGLIMGVVSFGLLQIL